MNVRVLALLLFSAITCGCQIVPDRSQVTVQLYDIGIPEERTLLPCCEGQVVLASVRAAPMLKSQNMWYRMGSDSMKPSTYAVSRWVANPASLIEQYVRIALGVAESERFDGAPYRMDIKLEAMEQQFHNGGSTAVLIVSVTLSRTSDRSVVENEVFRLSEPTDSADPLGGAEAQARLASLLVDQLQRWMCDAVE